MSLKITYNFVNAVLYFHFEKQVSGAYLKNLTECEGRKWVPERN